MKPLPGNSYDGHTLATVIPDMESLVGNTVARILADKGYRGHNAPPDYKFRVFMSGQKRGVTFYFQDLKFAFEATALSIGFLRNQALAFGVYWLADKILDLHSLNAGTLSALIGSLISVQYGSSRIEGKLVLARMCAFVLSFTEQIFSIPADQRIGIAKRSYLDNKTIT